MLHRYSHTLLAVTLCASLLACSTNTKQPDVHTPITTFAWDTPLPGAPDKIEITYKLPQKAHADILLFKRKVGHKGTALARAQLSNDNCLRGHQAGMAYATNEGAFYSQYFTQELSWNSHNTITIQWIGDNTLKVTANNESLSVPITDRVRWLQILTYEAPIEIQQVKYISK